MKIRIPKKKTYSNGATLIYKHRKKRATSVTAGFVFGTNRDNYPEPTAHFCEHMFFKATENKNENQLRSAMLDTFSGYNGRTNQFYTEIDFCRSNKAIEPCFKLASEMLLETKFNAKSINSEKGVIKQELVRRLNNPDQMFRFTCNKTFRTKYIENTTVLGSEKEIDAMDAKTLKKFRDETFIAQNFVITIYGGLSYSKAKRLAEKYFIKKLKSNPEYPTDQNIVIPISKTGNMQVDFFNFKKAICNVTYKFDEDFATPKNEKTLQMLCSICNGISGKFFARLRDKGLVYDARMSYQTRPNHMLAANFNCSSENVNKCIEEFSNVLKDLRTTLVDKEILEKKKENRKLAEDELITPLYPDNLFYNYLAHQDEIFSKKFIKEARKSYEELTPQDLKDACQIAYSKPENIYVSILSDKAPETFYTYQQIQDLLTKYKKPRKTKQIPDESSKQPEKTKKSVVSQKTASKNKTTTKKKTSTSTKKDK